MHWQGVQQLSLEAVLRGCFENAADWTTVLRGAELTRERNSRDFWALGTIAELQLLAPLAGRPSNLPAAREALVAMKSLAEKEPGEKEAFAIQTTRRQIGRYIQWWTKANGFFANQPDVTEAAQDLLKSLN
jgi:hypothetical protein